MAGNAVTWDSVLEEDPGKQSLREKVRSMGREQREANRVVVSEAPTVRIPKGLKRHQHFDLYEKKRWIVRNMAFNGILSLVLAISLNELHWSKVLVIPPRNANEGPIYVPDQFDIVPQILKVLVSINVFVLVMSLFRYYNVCLELGKVDELFLPQDNYYSSGMLRLFLAEFFILVVHPLPFVSFQIDINEVFGYSRYDSDELFTVLMLPRVYLLFRVFRDELKLNHETVAYHGKLSGVNLDNPYVIFKQLVNEFPLQTVPVLYLCTIFVTAYAMMSFERPADERFQSYANAVWCVLVTMTTVGYGDIYPTTNAGRFLAMIDCATALVLYSILVVGMKRFMTYDEKELKCFHLLKRKRWKAVRNLQAIILIQTFWRSVAPIGKGIDMSKLATFLRDTNLCCEVRKFRTIRELQPLEEVNIASTLWSVYETVSDIRDKVDDLSEKLDLKAGVSTSESRI